MTPNRQTELFEELSLIPKPNTKNKQDGNTKRYRGSDEDNCSRNYPIRKSHSKRHKKNN